MKTYLVGGAVRDRLLGLPVSDRDWVVVGATPEQMIARGFRPVGRDFPVFLHPETHEEYALARTERKTAAGYHGFAFHTAPDVTLEQDLARRDLTINAIAEEIDIIGGKTLFDPYLGQKDLRAKVLRHVTGAFREDPVRILRVARFAARFTDFSIAPETQTLMREMAEAGEVDALVAERVWQELSRGLVEAKPSRMIEVLRECGVLRRLLPELDRLFGVAEPAGEHLLRALDLSARLDAPLAVRFACLTHNLGAAAAGLPRQPGPEQCSTLSLAAVCDRFRVPSEVRQLADVVARERDNIDRSFELNANALFGLLVRCDAIRKPARFADALLACECAARARVGRDDAPYPQRDRLLAALAAAQSVETAKIAREAGTAGPEVGERIRAARAAAIAATVATRESADNPRS